MSYQLKPKSPAGKKYVNAAESLTESIRYQAQAAEQSSTGAAASFDDIKTAGINEAFVPEDCGGMGLSSIHDWIVGMSRLGRGDGSVALATNKHLAVSRGLSSGRASAQTSGNDLLAKAIEAQLEQIVTGNMTICATATEPGTDNLHPLTLAAPVDDGWRVDGLKLFVTGSPIASHIAINLRVKGDDDKPDSISSVMMPPNNHRNQTTERLERDGNERLGKPVYPIQQCLCSKSRGKPCSTMGTMEHGDANESQSVQPPFSRCLSGYRLTRS